MVISMYADEVYYVEQYGGDKIPPDLLKKALVKASRHIDSLTYNKIIGQGFSDLTDFQQKIIQDTCCELADFEFENSDMIESVLQNYSINGVSMSFGKSWNVRIRNGVAIPADAYDGLSQTGLCGRELCGRW